MDENRKNFPETAEAAPGTIPLWPDAGKRLGLGRAATYNAYHRGDLPFTVIRIGKKLLVARAAVERVLA